MEPALVGHPLRALHLEGEARRDGGDPDADPAAEPVHGHELGGVAAAREVELLLRREARVVDVGADVGDVGVPPPEAELATVLEHDVAVHDEEVVTIDLGLRPDGDGLAIPGGRGDRAEGAVVLPERGHRRGRGE